MLRIFYIYSNEEEDAALKRWLDRHLRPLSELNIVHWDDHEITPGQEWDTEIKAHLNEADIILLLISSDFMASQACWEQMKAALARHDKAEAQVIPIILRPVVWDNTPFSNLSALPTTRKPIATWSNRDEACVDVRIGVDKAIQEVQIKQDVDQQMKKANGYFSQALHAPSHYDEKTLYEGALSIYEKALLSLKRTSYEKYIVDVLRRVGNTQRRLNRNEEALEAFDEAIQRSLHIALGNSRIPLLFLYKEKSDVLLDLGYWNDAIEVCEAALACASKGAALAKINNFKEALSAEEQMAITQVCANKGIAFASSNQFQSALVAFDGAIAREANNADFWRWKGIICAELGYIEKAKSSYVTAIELKQNDASLHKAYGDILFRFNCFEEARVEYSKAIELNKDFTYAYRGRSEATKALILELMKSAEEDEKQFKRLTSRSNQ